MLWQFSNISLGIIPSIVPLPSSKFINVSGMPFLSLICLTLLIKATNEAFLISLFNSFIFFDLIFLILLSKANTG